ncbi:hypothetical protein BaRGS_00020817 [Batillaria attramentaria]|uniref:Uncharacterized protein n=1 Tax=Batillaria attramentaria TaxID=370345 RepID=A0ABD0KKZ8_9CAEN
MWLPDRQKLNTTPVDPPASWTVRLSILERLSQHLGKPIPVCWRTRLSVLENPRSILENPLSFFDNPSQHLEQTVSASSKARLNSPSQHLGQPVSASRRACLSI